MQDITLYSWNVNGIRAVLNKGFIEWIEEGEPDILCIQETKVQEGQADEGLSKLKGYHTYWSYAEQKGYSGVATFTREKPVKIEHGLAIERFDAEGRVVITTFSEFTLMNIYFPNGKKNEERLEYKMEFYHAFLEFVTPLQQRGERIIVCGDFNTAHKEIDLARPKPNSKISGFLPVEREWIDTFINHGYIDIFRRFNSEPDQYTFWDVVTRARERNIGWRIDYFFVTENVVPLVDNAFILPDVMGSDHCPIGLTLKLG
jgi:exodeoxyribonuclease-3